MRQLQVTVLVVLAVTDAVMTVSYSQVKSSEFPLVHNPNAADYPTSSGLRHPDNSRTLRDFNHMFFSPRNHFPNRNPVRKTIPSNPHVPPGIESLSSGDVNWNSENLPLVKDSTFGFPGVGSKGDFNTQLVSRRSPASNTGLNNPSFEAAQQVPSVKTNILTTIAPLLRMGGNVPAAIAPLPLTESSVPSAIAPLQQRGNNLPAAIAPLPQTGSNLPAAIAPLPQTGSNLPAAIAPLPQTGSNLPAAIAPLPQAESNLSAAIAPLPQAESNLPAAIAPLPQAESNLPAAIAPLPQAESNLPAAIAPLPQTDSNAPAAIATLPQTESNVPAAITPLPQIESNLPAAIAPLPQTGSNVPAAIAPLPQNAGNILPVISPSPGVENNIPADASSSEVGPQGNDQQNSAEVSPGSPSTSQNEGSQSGINDSIEIAEPINQTPDGDSVARPYSQSNQGFFVKPVTNHIALEPSSPEDTSEQLAISLKNMLPSNNYLYSTDDSPLYVHGFTDEVNYLTRDTPESLTSEETETTVEEESKVTSVDYVTEAMVETSESSTQELPVTSTSGAAEASETESINAESPKKNEQAYEEIIKKLETDENVLNAKYKFLAAWNNEVARQGVYMLRIANVYPETGFVYMPDIEYYTRSLQVSPAVQAATADLMSAWRKAKDQYSLDGIPLNGTRSSPDEGSTAPSRAEGTSNIVDSPQQSNQISQIGSLRFEFPQVSGSQAYPYQPYILPNNRVYLDQPYLSYINSIFPYLSFLQRGNVVQPRQPIVQALNPEYFQGITRPADVENAIPVGNNEIPGRVPDQWDVKDLTRPNDEPKVSPPAAAHHRPAKTQVQDV